MEINDLIQKYGLIIVSSASVYLCIIGAIRLFGKKEFAHLSVFDLVFVLLISNSAQNAMVGSDTSLGGGLVAALTLFMLNTLLKFIIYKFPSLLKVLTGEPILFIYKGTVKDENLRREHISINELLETVHEHGIHQIKEVDLAILESDGNISVLSHDFKSRSSHTRKHRKKFYQ
jgi:uncharacterized membrane protein YcaP (DUF421 family)